MTRRQGRLSLGLILFLVVPGVQPAAALEFAFEAASRFGQAADLTVMTLRGEIREGDFARLRRFVNAEQQHWREYGAVVVPIIDGGDVEEAKSIGAFLRDALSEIRLPDIGSSRCISACFFVLVQSVERHAQAGTVGVHRPYFNQAALAAADPKSAHARYAAMLASLRASLTEWAVPQALIERIFATPSSVTYWLSTAELAQLGTYQPWFAEYASARCGLDAQADQHLMEMHGLGDDAGAAALVQSQQRAATCLSTLRRAQRERLLDAGETR